LKRHLERFHPEISNKVTEKDKAAAITQQASAATASTSSVCGARGKEPKLTKFLSTDKITVTMTAEKFRKSITDLVVHNGVALSLFSQPVFLELTGEMVRKFGISLERQSIRKLVINEAADKKEELTKTLQGRYMHLKMGAATRHRVNYFAINARFVDDDGKNITRTLAVKDIKAHHDSTYLQHVIEGVLEEYHIQKQQIVSIVTDNASNMIKTIENLNEDSNPMEKIESEMAEQENEEHRDATLDDVTEEASKLCAIRHTRCAVHTLQLAIRDGLEDTHSRNLIGKLRQVATAARTPKIDAVLKKRAKKGAIIDQATLWGSTYMMVKRLLELKTFLEDSGNPAVSLSRREWNDVLQLEAVLAFPFAATKRMQAEELTAGTFLWGWKNLIFMLRQRVEGPISKAIITSMEKWEAQLLNNNILLAAVFVDPSNRVLLNENQKIIAKHALCRLAVKLKGLESETSHSELTDQPNIEADHSSSCSEDQDFNKYLNKMEKCQIKKRRLDVNEPLNAKMEKFKQHFHHVVEEIEEKYNRSCKLPMEELLPLYPEIIRDAAHTVTALPTTQASVERLFFALKITKSDLRASTKEDIAGAVLFLKTYK